MMMFKESGVLIVVSKDYLENARVPCRCRHFNYLSLLSRFLVIIVVLFIPGAVDSLSSTPTRISRRQVLSNMVYGYCGGGAFLVPLLLTTTSAACDVAHAACLPGDDSVECIGVYKVPVDSSRDLLKEYAPQLNYDGDEPSAARPQSYQGALGVLSKQRLAANDITEAVTAGRLEEAGVKVLKVLPKLTLAGRVIVSSFNGEGVVEGLRRSKIERQLQELEALWGQLDVSIGQGLRGQLGVSAAAQIRILDELKECAIALEDFQRTAIGQR